MSLGTRARVEGTWGRLHGRRLPSTRHKMSATEPTTVVLGSPGSRVSWEAVSINSGVFGVDKGMKVEG